MTAEPAPGAKYVYFIQVGAAGPIKIGIGQDPEQRLFGLQCGNPESLRIIGVIPAVAADYERQLHLRFQASHLRGEWFKPAADLLAFIASESVSWARPRRPDSELPRSTNTVEIDNNLLRRLRKRASVTQGDLARRIGISHQYVSFLEQGHRRANPAVLDRICAALELQVEERAELLLAEQGVA